MRRALPVVLLAPLVLWPVTARSTTVEALDHPEMVKRAAEVVWGQVTSVESEWNEAHTRIQTRVRITPREVLKGDPKLATVELVLPGGELDGKVTVVHGMPRFRSGQELVVYKSAPHPRSGIAVPIGLGQGVWEVSRPAADKVDARRDTRELQLAAPGARGLQRGAVEELPLPQLLQKIRDEVQRQKDGK